MQDLKILRLNLHKKAFYEEHKERIDLLLRITQAMMPSLKVR